MSNFILQKINKNVICYFENILFSQDILKAKSFLYYALNFLYFKFIRLEKEMRKIKNMKKHFVVVVASICLLLLLIILEIFLKRASLIETSGTVSKEEFFAPKREVYPLKEGEKICYLTFDDGPSENTIKILDILKEYDAKATFFVIGNCLCEENKPILERIMAEGHAVGLHAYNHVYEKFYNSETSFLEDYKKLYEILKEEYGIETALFRFPGGSACKFNYGKGCEYVNQMQQLGFACFDWNVTGEDSVGNPTVESIQKNVFERVFQYEKPVVLLHDSCIADMTVNALPGILEKLKEQGYQFASLEHRKEYVFSKSRKMQ